MAAPLSSRQEGGDKLSPRPIPPPLTTSHRDTSSSSSSPLQSESLLDQSPSANSSLEAAPAAAGIPSGSALDDRPPTSSSSASSPDEDGFSLITAEHYHDYDPLRTNPPALGATYRRLSLIETVGDSFRPTLDGHRSAHGCREDCVWDEGPSDDRLAEAREVADTAAALDATPPPEPAAPWPLRQAVPFGQPVDHGDHLDDGLSSVPASRSVESMNIEELWEAFSKNSGIVSGLKRPLQVEPHMDENTIKKIRIMNLPRPSSYGTENLPGNESDSESDSPSVSNLFLDSNDDASSSKEPQPSTFPPHLRNMSAQGIPHRAPGPEEPTSAPSHGTSEQDKKAAAQRLIESIDLDELASLVTHTFALCHQIDLHVAVEYTLDEDPIVGSKNIFYRIKLHCLMDVGRLPPANWLVRIPLSARNFTLEDRLWLESDIEAMRFIRDNTDIPIPELYAADTTNTNSYGFPFVIMDCMKGGKVEDLWRIWSDEEKRRCLSQCAKHMSKLGKFAFDKIGVLGLTRTEEKPFVKGILSESRNGETGVSGPFTSTEKYLEHIWQRQIREVQGSTETEAIKTKNHLVLLKLLEGLLIEPASKEKYYLSLPEFGGGNVLVDLEGNVTGFVGWERTMILPKNLGYARYPGWLAEDWVPSLSPRSPEPRSDSRYFSRPVPSRNPSAEASSSSSDGRVSGIVTGDQGGAPKNPVATCNPEIRKEDVNDDQETTDSTSEVAGSSEAGSSSRIDGQSRAPHESHKLNTIPNNNNNTKKGAKSKKWRNRNGNRHETRPQSRTYDEAAELQNAYTEEDKARVLTLSQWNTLAAHLENEEAELKENRRKQWEAKNDAEKAAALKQACVAAPVIETFKRVLVADGQVRKLISVSKIERDGRDEQATAAPSDMARYRAVYHDLLSLEDSLAAKTSLVPTALHAALQERTLRSHIVPTLAKQVFGDNIGPNILTMVGGSPWAERLLAKLDSPSANTTESETAKTELPKPQATKESYLYHCELVCLFVLTAIVFIASCYHVAEGFGKLTGLDQTLVRIYCLLCLVVAVALAVMPLRPTIGEA